MYNCNNCKVEIAYATKVCPNCGTQINWDNVAPPQVVQYSQPIPPAKKKNGCLIAAMIVIGIGILIAIIVVACTATAVKSVSNSLNSITNHSSQLELVGGTNGTKGEIDSSTGSITITGSIKNNSDSAFTYVDVTFNLYDKDGNQVGTAMANITSLEANGTWKFSAFGMEKGISTYKLDAITGY